MEAADARLMADARAGTSCLEIGIDGTRSLAAGAVAAVHALCDRSEEKRTPQHGDRPRSGAPTELLPQDLTIALISKWERALRRLERLRASTIAVADGDCGGMALDALLVGRAVIAHLA